MLQLRFCGGQFINLLIYCTGSVTQPADLRRPEIWRAVASRLGEWHAVIPCLPARRVSIQEEVSGSEDRQNPAPTPSKKDPALQLAIDNVAPGKPAPNVWSVMQKWIYALPVETHDQRDRQATLQRELTKLVEKLGNRPGLGKNGVSTNTIFYVLDPGDQGNYGNSKLLSLILCLRTTFPQQLIQLSLICPKLFSLKHLLKFYSIM